MLWFWCNFFWGWSWGCLLWTLLLACHFFFIFWFDYSFFLILSSSLWAFFMFTVLFRNCIFYWIKFSLLPLWLHWFTLCTCKYIFNMMRFLFFITCQMRRYCWTIYWRGKIWAWWRTVPTFPHMLQRWMSLSFATWLLFWFQITLTL